MSLAVAGLRARTASLSRVQRRAAAAIVLAPVCALAGGLLELNTGAGLALGVLLAGQVVPADRARDRLLWTAGILAWAVVLPLLQASGGGFLDTAILALAYCVMALGLNVIVGYAGLLDVGYVAFFALGAITMGWLGSGFVDGAGGGTGVHILVSDIAGGLPGIHVNFILVLLASACVTTVAGVIIGLPTLRLRGDYIAVVTLAFGEIIGRLAQNGTKIEIGGQPLTAGRQGITPVDPVYFPGIGEFSLLDLRPWYWLALGMTVAVGALSLAVRDSKHGRAWVALRDDEEAAVAMGIPAVRTKLLAYGTGAAFGGMAGAFLASYLNTVNSDQFQFSFSIFILAMVVVGGLGSVRGVIVGAVTLAVINNKLIPDVFNGWPAKVGLDVDLTELSFGIFGFLLILMMLARPAGLLPDGPARHVQRDPEEVAG